MTQQTEMLTGGFTEQKRRTGKGMSGGHRVIGGKDEWLTPPEIIQCLGQFDLDPCAPVKRPWPTADRHYTVEDNGLICRWVGRVWLNPPYGSETGKWLKRLADHGNGIALIFARTETADWHDHIWNCASAILFLRGRLNFYHVDGHKSQANAGAPSALVAYGENNTAALTRSGLSGYMVKLR